MNLSNHTLWLGCLYEMTLASLSSVRFATGGLALARTWESLRAIAGNLFRRID